MDGLTIDVRGSMQETIGEGGPTRAMLDNLRPLLEQARASLRSRRAAGQLTWADLSGADPSGVLAYAAESRGRYESLLVLGTGGSALGTTALGTALLPPFYNLRSARERQGHPRLFVLDNVDPDETKGLLDLLDPRTTLVNVVSKSGATAETMAAYLVVRQILEQTLGTSSVREHLVFTTDPASGVLRRIGLEEGIPMFDIPAGVGGRFSVLCPVGLLPAALTGMDVRALLEGAGAMDKRSSETDVLDDPAHLFAALSYLHDTAFGRRIDVLMPYSSRLRDLADWFRQLWAESLGKAVDRQGRERHVGLTPVDGLGATDQHSQVQLYTEGPDDKLLAFVRVGCFDHDLRLPALHPDEESLAYLSGHTMGELLNAEQRATAWALARRGRPSITLEMSAVDASNVGALIYMLEMATAVAGELYDIDAFDQPGVELGKKATYALMGRAGYEGLAREVAEFSAGGGEAE